jgi:hypothetical protein
LSQIKNPGFAKSVPAGKGPAADAVAEASVRQLIANGRCKAALESAKQHHKALGTPASEALLVDAYAARIEALLQQNLTLEAKSLIEVVDQRYPANRTRLEAVSATVAGRSGTLDTLIAPLSDPQLSSERRTAIEQVVRRDVTDLSALASCASLSPEHPLRRAATALDRAFTAVTSGSVTSDVIALTEVPHRSPLASWKLLVRAIASFYRHDDAACQEQFNAIGPDSAAARLVPAMLAMLGLKSREDLTPSAAALVSQATVDSSALRKALNCVERLIDDGHERAVLAGIRTAVQECRKSAPEQLERLKQHIGVRCVVAGLDKGKVTAALGGQVREDAYFFRLLARGLEQSGSPEDAALACGIWDEFRKQAVREGWFAPNGAEAAALYLHIAEVLRRLPKELYQRACTLDPHREAFAEWFEWASGQSPREAERVAEAWHKVRPVDIDPILHLMESAADRKAFPKALTYLVRAERIDSVHPEVRRARLRLLVGGVLRHIQQNKPHLAALKLAELSALPESQQKDRPAFLAALRFLLSLANGDAERLAAECTEVERLLGSSIAAKLLLFGVAAAAKRGEQVRLEPCERLAAEERMALPAAVARVTALARDMNTVNLQLPWMYVAEAARQLPQVSASLDTSQLQTLAEAGVSARHIELGYAASAAGLGRGGPTEARFLLLRALSLPEQRFERRAVCAAAALELARDRRDQKVVHEAVEFLQGPLQSGALSLTLDEAGEVLRTEKEEPKGFAANRRDPDYDRFLQKEPCDCPECREARSEISSPFKDGEDIFDEMPMPPDMPPEIARMLFEETRKAVERGESLESLLARLLPGGAPTRGRRKGTRRR